MREIQIPIASDADPRAVERSIEQAVSDRGLDVTLRASLRKFPRCVHWHVKRRGEPGTLEITYWPQEHRAWFTVQDGRRAAWIDEQVGGLAEAIRRRVDVSS